MATRSILFCEPAFQFECPIRWDALQTTDDAAVRMCSTCERTVHFCETLDQAIGEAAAGHCVAVPSSMRGKPLRLGELILSEAQVELHRVRSLGQRPSASLVARATNIPFIDVLRLRIDSDVAAKLPAKLAFEQQAIAFFENERSVFIAMSDPNNFFVIDQMKEVYGKNVEISVAGAEEIDFRLRELFPEYVPASP